MAGLWSIDIVCGVAKDDADTAGCRCGVEVLSTLFKVFMWASMFSVVP